MVQRAASTPPLNLQFEVSTSLHRLVSEALTPSYQISKHLVPGIEQTNCGSLANGHAEHGITASLKSSRQAVEGRDQGMGDSIRAFQERMFQLHRTIDSSLEFVTKVLRTFERADVKPVILDVCPTVTEITLKPDGIGLLKAMGVLTGLALALAVERNGSWSDFKSGLLTRSEDSRKYYEIADRLLELAKRHPEDKLLSEVTARLSVQPVLKLADRLLVFTKMTLSNETTKCRRYLEEFIPSLMWPLSPVQGYFEGFSASDAGAKTRAPRQHPGVEVVADRLFGREAAKTIFFGARSSKSLNDAGRHFALSLSKIAEGKRPTRAR